MTSPNLIPTRIVNKNGVPTTVYKSSVDQPSGASKLPAPAAVMVTTTPPTVKTMKRLIHTMKHPHVTVPSEITVARIERALYGYPDETQAFIASVLERDEDDDDFLDRMIISMVNERHSPEDIEDALFVYENLPDSWDAITQDSDWGEDGFHVEMNLRENINGARGYTADNYNFGNGDYSLRHYDEKTQKQALALIELSYAMLMEDNTMEGLRYDDTSHYINDARTVQFIADNPERVEEVFELMQRRGHEWDSLEPVLTASVQPLRDGNL